MDRRRVALATSAALPSLTPDDRLVVDALADLGIVGEAAIWSDSSVDWSAFDVVVLRSTWDYHRRPEAFQQWTSDVATRTTLLNPLAAVRWNADKRYLADVAAAGLPIVPTVWLGPDDATDVPRQLVERGWSDAIVKPRISATAHRLHRISAHDPDTAIRLAEDAISGHGALLQPFVPSVAQAGELSLVFLGDTFGHAVRKVPRSGEFRVQHDYGGHEEAAAARPAELELARRTLALSPTSTLYARVDLVHDAAGDAQVMELELIEPALFFLLGPASARLMAERIRDWPLP